MAPYNVDVPIYIVDKPLHSTSHDVVAQARRALGTRKVGHGGTLDPLASGVLALLVGDDTKLSPFLTGSRKRYLAWVSFGATSPTLDAEGPLERVSAASTVSEEGIASALPAFLDLSQQVPPQYSAIKMGGVKGYEAARKGERLELPLRPARYFEATLLAFAEERSELPDRVANTDGGKWAPAPTGRPVPLPDVEPYPSALIRLEVAAGTYIRSFARDLGERLGTGAFLSGLLRTGAGRLDLAAAVDPARLPDATPLRPVEALPYPRHALSESEAARVRKGQRLPLRLETRSALVDPHGELVAIAEEEDGRMKLLRVWAGD